jgi:hypothetical protein
MGFGEATTGTGMCLADAAWRGGDGAGGSRSFSAPQKWQRSDVAGAGGRTRSAPQFVHRSSTTGPG